MFICLSLLALLWKRETRYFLNAFNVHILFFSSCLKAKCTRMKMCASSFQSHSNLLPLAGLTGSLCSALSTGQAVQQQWLKTVSPFQEPPPGPISKPPSSTSAVDTPAKPVWWHARCLRDTEHFSFSTGYSSNKKCPRQEHSGFLIFHVGEHIKKLNPCRNICLIKKTSGLEKSAPVCGILSSVCHRWLPLCDSQLGRVGTAGRRAVHTQVFVPTRFLALLL